MYFPYVRGRQYELLALRELALNNLLGSTVIPIVEPVKLSPTLVNTMEDFIKLEQPIAIIGNPSVGSFLSDLDNAKNKPRDAGYSQKFKEFFNYNSVIKTVIIGPYAKELLEKIEKMGINKSEIIVINSNRDYMSFYENHFAEEAPLYTLIPDESIFRRKTKQHKVLLDDKFEKQDRNADYQDTPDEFFSDDHLYYKDDGFEGFSDYSVIGNEYLDSGFAPYAVAIHIVYFADDKTLRVRHFVSDTNDDISNPALKFYEAVKKLAKWYEANSSKIALTKGLEKLLTHYKQESYPGLGTIKKLSLMHHIELVGKYLSEE